MRKNTPELKTKADKRIQKKRKRAQFSEDNRRSINIIARASVKKKS